ncbi:phage major capsid protein [Paracoccus sp. SCSIO 75233]|uniref:phage major capsid protein n=1 Tax=Paracoccus sp. SCSIO 75233 TaxID=3017782 RepID=UPI0022EFDF5C|nr:phage major capsid protein [Paracoccus sp. SCSIO 75233]WBU53838.1 phage major capsid protein [Paracoccus sp. SCSIO 75233]
MTGTGTGAPHAPGELKAALMGFVEELKGFREDVQKKLEAQDDRMSMFERKTAFRNRSPLSTEAAPEVPHGKAFNAYLRSGDDAGMRGLAIEEKGMAAASDGGFLAAPQVADTVRTALTGAVSLRALCNVVTVEAASYDVLVERDELVSGWSGEGDQVETDTGAVQRISIPVHELSAMPKVSQRLLDDAAFDVEAWLAGRIAEKFTRAEAYAFLRGDGIEKPQGLVAGLTDPTGVGAIDSIGEIRTGADGAFASGKAAEVLIDLVYALHAQHRANATFLMSSRMAATLRKLKDGDGRFIWADSLAAGEPARLLGYPVMLAEDMPEMAPGSLSVLFGDFRAAYTIVERPELRVLRDPFSAKPHVLFYATKRVGGGLVDGRALKALRFSA